MAQNNWKWVARRCDIVRQPLQAFAQRKSGCWREYLQVEKITNCKCRRCEHNFLTAVPGMNGRDPNRGGAASQAVDKAWVFGCIVCFLGSLSGRIVARGRVGCLFEAISGEFDVNFWA